MEAAPKEERSLGHNYLSGTYTFIPLAFLCNFIRLAVSPHNIDHQFALSYLAMQLTWVLCDAVVASNVLPRFL